MGLLHTPVKRTTLVFLFLFFIFLTGFSTALGTNQAIKDISTYGDISYSSGDMSYSLNLLRAATSHSFQGITEEEIAEYFDITDTWPTWMGPRLSNIKELNPDIIMLLYRNYRAVYKDGIGWTEANENNWLLKDADGDYCVHEKWPQNYMVDIGNPEYQDWNAKWIADTITKYGYDGVKADCSLSAYATEQWFSVVKSSDTSQSTSPVNPRTGKNWTPEEVRTALIQSHQKVRSAIGSKIIIANGIFNGQRFFKRQSEYIEVINEGSISGVMAEDIWYKYGGSWYTEDQWLESVRLLKWMEDSFIAGSKNRYFWLDAKINRGSLPTGATLEQRGLYSFASSLMAIRSNQIALRLESTDRREDFIDYARAHNFIQSLHEIEIGQPLGEYYKIGGTNVYVREFTKVIVYVNPTDTDYEVDGIIISAHTGKITYK